MSSVDYTPEPVFSHFGICVGDLERSLRFYCDALGFEKAESHEIGSEFARLMEFPDVDVTSQFIRRGPTAIELLAFRHPSARANGGPSTSSG
jgi:glyoxylase I family protein